MTLDKLIENIARGDTPSFNELYDETKKAVYYIALSIVKDRALAEDVMQNAYLNIIKGAPNYTADTNATAWIARITRNEALNARKKAGRELYVDQNENLSVFGTEQTDDYGLLIDLARRTLPDDEFAILMLVTAKGYKRREIAEMFDLPVSTVTWKFNQAVQKMRKSLEM